MWGLGTNMMAHGLSLSLRQSGKWGKDRNKGGGIKASFSQGGVQVFITKEQSSIYCNGSTRAGLGMGQIRPRDFCPSATTHHRRVALKRNASFLSIVLGRHPSFHITISHLLHLRFTLAVPQTPRRHKADHSKLDGRCHKCVPHRLACQ